MTGLFGASESPSGSRGWRCQLACIIRLAGTCCGGGVIAQNFGGALAGGLGLFAAECELGRKSTKSLGGACRTFPPPTLASPFLSSQFLAAYQPIGQEYCQIR
ncbi:hypothetical protein BDN72DRAFT_848131 [Pluteus cervinus]|uniref:Uncharacterized protein n=1 Tax=Pluteus cervinus TaxID=181527 RepID=A0ACD3ADT5_9AGAR|nr:hypothetical protein BDN72DRAFT_848131 [Pluteus cervinus]